MFANTTDGRTVKSNAQHAEKLKAQKKGAQCNLCPLQKAPIVPSLIPKTQSNGLAFLGESPGTEEKRKGIPFVGPSGKLLTKCLEIHDINKDQTLLTNAALCNYRDDQKDVLPKAIECCRPRLLQELQDNEIHTAVTLGNAAKDSLLHTKDGITKVRGGNPRPSDYAENLKVIPTFHPAFCLRDQGRFPLMLQDIGKINAPKERLWREPNITVIDDPSKALRVLTRTNTQDPIVLDVETGKEKEEQYGRTTNLLCVGLGSTSHNHRDNVVVIGRPAIYDPAVQDALCALLSRTGVICQNGKFDTYIISTINHHNLPIWLHADTMLMSYSLNEVPGTHGLKYMGVEYLGTPHWEEEIQKYLVKPKDTPEVRQAALHWIQSALADPAGCFRTDVLRESPVDEAATKRAAKELSVIEFKGSEGEKYANRIRWALPSVLPEIAPPDADGSYASIPAPILHKYNAFDVQVTRQLYFLFRERQHTAGLVEFNEHLMRMSNALMRVERNGLRVDREFNAELYRQFTEYIDALRPNFEGINPGSVKQLKRFIEDEFDRTLDSTAEEAITNEINTVGQRYPDYREFCENLLEFRRWTKLRSTYVTSIRKQADENNGFVLPTFKIDQATTGRLASKNPNVQNMPRQFDIKRQFIPSNKDRVFVHADYSQLELRVITWLAQDHDIAALFNDPSRDVFDELASSVYGITSAEFQRLKEQQPKMAKEMRVVVKSFAYGTIYGRTAHGIAQDPDLNLDIAEAERVSQLFKAQIPGIMAFQQGVIRQIHEGKDLVNIFGRHRRFHLITNQNKHDLEKQAMAFLPQSTASDICVTALSRLPESFDPRNIIHDAILLEAPRDEAHSQGQRLVDIMIETAEEITGGYVKFDVEYEIGENWQNLVDAKDWHADAA
jgi:uracil-DNA glycosylase family 4